MRPERSLGSGGARMSTHRERLGLEAQTLVDVQQEA